MKMIIIVIIMMIIIMLLTIMMIVIIILIIMIMITIVCVYKAFPCITRSNRCYTTETEENENAKHKGELSSEL